MLAWVKGQVLVAEVEVNATSHGSQKVHVYSANVLAVPSSRFATMKTYHPEQLHSLPRIAPAEELGANWSANGRALAYANLLFFLAQGSNHNERSSTTTQGLPAASGQIVQR